MTATMSLPKVQYDQVQFDGGMDQVTPTLRLKPGVPRDSLNFECAITGGHTRIAGYERFDGRAKPSAATYSYLQLENFINEPALLSTLTGQTTGTTGIVIAVGDNYLIVTLVVGAGFTTTEVIKVGATLIGTLIPLDIVLTSLQNAQYLNLAADVYRSLIGAVPGSGSVRGIFAMLNAGVHEVFAFRDNVGSTACDLFKATTSGWSQVAYLKEVAFTLGGATAPTDGLTLTQGANTATIKRVMLESGSWASNTAAGRFIITTPAPGNFTAGAATIGAINVTLSGVQTAITFTPGGKFELDLGNFSGQLTSKRIYGCDTVNRCFEFDGVTLAPIKTGLTVDAPTHICVHQNHLFVGYGSSILNSGIGTPFNWTGTAGAAEYATGDTVNGIMVLPGDQTAPAMLVGCRSSFKIMYGSAAAGSDLFRLVSFDTETGMYAYSAQNLDQAYILDDRGIITLRTAQEFGNFLSGALTYTIAPFMAEKRTLLTYSCLNKDRSQYRLFFSDGTGIYATIVNGKYLGSMPIRFPNPMNCVFNTELANGNEITYAGGTNGFVYQLDAGSSFDGTDIEFYLLPNWNNMKNPRMRKRYSRASLEIQGSSYASVNFQYVLGYGSTEFIRQPGVDYASSFQGIPRWDAVSWDAFVWDGFTIGPVEIEMSGTGENIQPRLSGVSDYLYSFTINSLILHWRPRRGVR